MVFYMKKASNGGHFGHHRLYFDMQPMVAKMAGVEAVCNINSISFPQSYLQRAVVGTGRADVGEYGIELRVGALVEEHLLRREVQAPQFGWQPTKPRRSGACAGVRVMRCVL